MKRYLLSYGESTGEYNLDYGCFNRNRKVLGKIGEDVLMKRLKAELVLHRETIIYVQKNLEASLKKPLLDCFKNTRIKINFEEKLESLCKDKAKI